MDSKVTPTTKVTIINDLDVSVQVSVKLIVFGWVDSDNVKYRSIETSENVNLSIVETEINMKRTYEDGIDCILYLYLDDCAYKYELSTRAYSPYVITIKTGKQNPIVTINNKSSLSRRKAEHNVFLYMLCCGSYDCALDF